MVKHKKIEDYNTPTNDVTATFKIGNTSISCTPGDFRETALEVISEGFSQNAVSSYNRMIAERQKDPPSCLFSDSTVAKKGYAYYNSEIINYNPIFKCSSVYMDVAIASSLAQKGQDEKTIVSETNDKCKGIVRNGAELREAYRTPTGYGKEVPPESTIAYYNKLYKENGLGDVRVNIQKESLANHLKKEGIKPGARIICDTEEIEQKSDEVIAYQAKNKTYFYKIINGRTELLDPSKAADKALFKKAKQAVKDKKLKVWNGDHVPCLHELSAERKSCSGADKLKIEYSYVKKETREYMYTGNNNGEPTFSRLTQNGGEIDVPLSQLPITQTKAIVDHTQLCVAKAQRELYDCDFNNVDIIRKYVPNLEVSCKLKKELAKGLKNPEAKASQIFNNTYNPDSPYIQRLMRQNEKSSNTAEIMSADKEKADMLDQQRTEAVKNSNTAPSASRENETTPEVTDNQMLTSALRQQQGGRL